MNNPLTFAVFQLLLKDLLRVYYCINEGVVNILGKFLVKLMGIDDY